MFGDNLQQPVGKQVLLPPSGTAFVNGGGAIADRVSNSVYLSRIFLWYASDFGGSTIGGMRPILDYIFPFLNDGETREWMATHRSKVKIRYQKYDWTLNGAHAT